LPDVHFLLLLLLEVHFLLLLQELLVSLQNQLLEFIKRLHTTEVERCRLLQEVQRLQEEAEKLGKEELVSEGEDLAITQQVQLYLYKLNNR